MLYLLPLLFLNGIIHVPQVGALANPMFNKWLGKGKHIALNPRCRTRCNDGTTLEDTTPDVEDPALISAANRPSIIVTDRPLPLTTGSAHIAGDLPDLFIDVGQHIDATPNTLGTPVGYGVNHIHILRTVGVFWDELPGVRLGNAIISFSDRSRHLFQVEATSEPALFAEGWHQRFGTYLTYFRLNLSVYRYDMAQGLREPPIRAVDGQGRQHRGSGNTYASYIFNPGAAPPFNQEEEFLATYDVAGTNTMFHHTLTHNIAVRWNIQYIVSPSRPGYMDHLRRIEEPPERQPRIHEHHLPGHQRPSLGSLVPQIPGLQAMAGPMPDTRMDILEHINSIRVEHPSGYHGTDPRGELIPARYPLVWGDLGEIARVQLSFYQHVRSIFYINIDSVETSLLQNYFNHRRRHLTFIRILIGVNARVPSGQLIPYVDRHVQPIEFDHDGRQVASWTFDARHDGLPLQTSQGASYSVESTRSLPNAHRITLQYHIEYLDSELPPSYALGGIHIGRPRNKALSRSHQLDRGKAHKHFGHGPPKK